MKKLLLLLFALPFFAMVVANDTSKFLGKWEGEDNKQIGYLTFEPDGFLFIEVDGDVMGGQEFDLDGKRLQLTFEVNDKKDPIELDLVMTNLEDPDDQKLLLCIVRFIDEDHFELDPSFDGQRHTEFNPVTTILFTRVKE
ncbi:MAG: hypothetical protein H6583_09245 [Alteromonas sp.]|nr:hypothetical protein [Flavobacteriaceae bacterium]MCB9213675.1 hypothetical protein [Alteromonas sp.]